MFADRIKASLPTLREWRVAATGDSGYKNFPWGETWKNGFANTGIQYKDKYDKSDFQSFGLSQSGLVDVNAKSKDWLNGTWEYSYGILHMIGNADEIVWDDDKNEGGFKIVGGSCDKRTKDEFLINKKISTSEIDPQSSSTGFRLVMRHGTDSNPDFWKKAHAPKSGNVPVEANRPPRQKSDVLPEGGSLPRSQ